jgi:hypothetical protein
MKRMAVDETLTKGWGRGKSRTIGRRERDGEHAEWSDGRRRRGDQISD